jgi:adenylosuccinate synthase
VWSEKQPLYGRVLAPDRKGAGAVVRCGARNCRYTVALSPQSAAVAFAARWAAKRLVGTARSFPTELTVPRGAAINVAGVNNVTVTGTHRRRGALNSMMGQQLEEVAGRGELTAMLIASEAPI